MTREDMIDEAVCRKFMFAVRLVDGKTQYCEQQYLGPKFADSIRREFSAIQRREARESRSDE